MFMRTSFVDFIKVKSVQFSSVIQLGDSSYIQGFSRALAVQREARLFYGNEGSFAEFPVFSKPIPFEPILENVSLQTDNLPSSSIKVGAIDILGVSASGVVHVGNSKVIQMESRVKHIRQLLHKGVSEKKQGNNGS